MQIISEKLDTMKLREVVTYKYDDMMVYLGLVATLSSLTIFTIILSL